jgi:uncharacterized protein (DUF885 family)
MARMKEGVGKGVVWPKVVIQKMIGPLKGLINDSVENNVFYHPSVMPDSFGRERKRLKLAYLNMITKKSIRRTRHC